MIFESLAARIMSIPPRLVWTMVIVLWLLECSRRIAMGHVPHDFSAYLAAVDVFTQGQDPYGDAIFDSPHYDGFPYVYPPGTLYLLYPMHWIPPAILSVAEITLRFATLIAILRYLQHRFVPAVPLATLVALAAVFEPVVTDYVTGNLPTFLLAATIGVVLLGSRGGLLGRCVGGFALGAFLSFKVFWLMPALYAAVCSRRWSLIISTATGAATVGALSLLDMSLVTSWLARLDEIRGYYMSVNLMELSTQIFLQGLAIWTVAALYLFIRRPHPSIWVFGCTSLCVWPRLSTYCFVLMLPVAAFLWQELGARRALLWSLPVLGPLPWLMQLSPDMFLHKATLLIWALFTAGLVFYLLNRAKRTSTDAPPLPARPGHTNLTRPD